MQLKKLLYPMTAMVIVAGCSEASEDANAGGPSATAAESSSDGFAGARLASATDGSLMTLNGTIASADAGGFRLDMGNEEVMVEMDDWDWYKEGKALKAGDRVTVTGRVDKGLWEQRKLEASSVYVHNLGMTFFASGADEEETVSALIPVDTVTSALGLVTSVEGQEFTVGAISGPVRVDTTQVKTKPQVKLGDRVYSWGDLDLDPAEGVELMAEGVVVISPDRTKKDASGPTRQEETGGPVDEAQTANKSG